MLVFCTECGKKISDRSKTCPGCGAPQIQGVGDEEWAPQCIGDSKSRGIAAGLALFLGGLGIHKFYLNRPRAGFAYLIFSWTLIPALLAIIDAFQLMMMSDSSFRKRYGYRAPVATVKNIAK
jgi:RNA polymerase subunit RPABC4/transcription elongation factor Spt4